MNLYAWIGVIGIVFFTWLPLLNKKMRTRPAIVRAILTIVIAIMVILAITLLHIPLLFAMIGMILAIFLLNMNWSRRRNLIILGVVIGFVGIGAYFVFKEDPEYVLNHLERHPESSSFMFAKNDSSLVSYQANERRSLASTMKIIIAIEYAEQVAQDKIDPQQKVSLDEPGRFYLKGTDGGAHSGWLEEMKEEDRIEDGKVALHDIAKGMITYSSNANTDYLLSVLGIDEVNQRIEKLGLKHHEPIYPIVGAILIPEEMQDKDMDDKEMVSTLRNLSDEAYRKKALEIHRDIEAGKLQTSDIDYNGSLKIQKVWSDRLPGATAGDYQKLMKMINQEDAFSKDVQDTIRDVLEWPMDVPGNEERFVHFGAKGGSTAFVLNQAMYAEDHDGNTFELVLFTDDLSLWQSFKLNRNHNEFIKKMFDEPEYWKDVKKALSSEDSEE
ncbi:MAG TPA: serine hydrolase [Bacillota bacterium]|nr:serine hydrolase [Bacillota bacterium]